jgi:hypothetical protein
MTIQMLMLAYNQEKTKISEIFTMSKEIDFENFLISLHIKAEQSLSKNEKQFSLL